MRFIYYIFIAFLPCLSQAAEIIEEKNQSYHEDEPACQLDLYRLESDKKLPCLVWFHGGGMTGGSKNDASSIAVARAFAAKGLLVACVGYRLHPKVKYPTYIEDAAAAVHWVKSHAASHGGDPQKIFVAGHSAGGYLSLMLGNDKRWLGHHGDAHTDLAGIISLSGQTITHFTIRSERGLADTTIIVDDAAPLHYANQPCAPQLILYAEKDMAMRAEENILYLSARAAAGHKQVSGKLMADTDHGNIGGDLAKRDNAVMREILAFIRCHNAKALSQPE
jgi:acetyl esterase/lipase